MLQSPRLLVSLLVLVLFAAPVLGSGGLSPVGPVVNGGFESPPIPPAAGDAIRDTPLDRCIGIGHQVFYGTDSPQHKAIDEGDPVGAAQQVAQDPKEEGRKASGLDHCVSSGSEGSDVFWVSPVHQVDGEPNGWSTCLDSSVDFGFDLDDDPFDREARVLADPTKCNHNMWQSFASIGQAWSLNFESFDFTVEDGVIGTSANVQLGFSLSPLYAQHPYVGVFYEGALLFNGEDLVPENGKVTVSPADATIICPDYQPCRDFRTDVENGDANVGQVRLVQLSFWNFNRGPTPVVIDDVAIVGATTVAEEAAAGNIKPNPTL